MLSIITFIALQLLLVVFLSQSQLIKGQSEYYQYAPGNVYSWGKSFPQGCECVESGASLSNCDIFRCTCACDLTAGKCDYNCCCDPDCTAEQTNRFTDLGVCSLERYTSDGLRYCYDDTELSKINHRASIKENDAAEAAFSDVLCIEVKNRYYEGEFYDNTALKPSSVFDTSLGKKDHEYTDTSPSFIIDSYYDQNDTITSFHNSTGSFSTVSGGVWSIPSADFSGLCNDQSYATYENEFPGPFSVAYTAPGDQFLNIASQEKSGKCIREFSTIVTTFENQCENAQSIKSYVFDLWVAKSADGTIANGEKTKVELKEVKYIDPNSGVVTDVELSVVTSINCPTQFVATSGDYDNYPSQCRFGTYSASPNNTCLNIVKSVKYVVQTAKDSVGTINNVYAYITITDQAFDSVIAKSMVQSFMLSFGDTGLGTSISNDEGNKNIRTRSGNPGYIVGAPLLWGTSNMDSVSYINEITEGLRIPAAVALSPNENLASVSSLDNCPTNSEESSDVAVPFGYDISSGCSMKLTKSELKAICCTGNTNCAGSYSSNYSSSEGLPIFLNVSDFVKGMWVGQYGNADPMDSTQWLSISSPSSLTSRIWDEAASTCRNMYSGLSYEFLIAKTGERAFPQNKVIAGRVQYIESDWVWRQAIDDSEETQSFPLSSIVTFVYKDDEKFNGYTPPPPPIIFNVPYDVFYPFEIENAAPSTTYPSLSLSISLSISISIALVLNWN